MKHITIVGGGIIGLALAYKLALKKAPIQVVVVEKESGVGRHQSSHNSGVLHAGLYYRPGSYKAGLAVSGIRQMTRFCLENGIPHELCGKLVVATDVAEVGRLRVLQAQGMANGLQGMKWVPHCEIKEYEPHAVGCAALHVPEEGIVDYAEVCRELQRHIESAGGQFHLSTEVKMINGHNRGLRLITSQDPIETDYLINCAGLYGDRVCKMAGETCALQIVPFRGQYYQLKPSCATLVRHLIYPVPDPRFPFLGVHFTRMISGGVEAGPNAALAGAREAYARFAFNLPEWWQAFTYPGLWRFICRYPALSAQEIYTTVNRNAFCRRLQKLVPAVTPDDLVIGQAGVRAQAMSTDGQLLQDFHLMAGDKSFHVLNAPSPGATASLAIADHVISQLPSELFH